MRPDADVQKAQSGKQLYNNNKREERLASFTSIVGL